MTGALIGGGLAFAAISVITACVLARGSTIADRECAFDTTIQSDPRCLANLNEISVHGSVE